MSVVGNKLKTIIEGQGLTYFRSSNIEDLNEQLGNIDVSGGVGIYANLPEIENTISGSGRVIMQYSIEVFYLQLNPETDDQGEAIDVILDAMKLKADELFDLLKSDPIISKAESISTYLLESADSLQLTKEVLTGWKVSMILPIDRTLYNCV